MNTKSKEERPYALGDEMRFSRENDFGNILSVRKNGQWSRGVKEPLGTDLYHSEISLSADGKTAWFTAGDFKNERLIFMRTQRKEDGSWGKAVPIE